jgi:hypothetical protein
MPTAADRFRRQAEFLGKPALPRVVDFAAVKRERTEASANRFSIVDRMTAHSWTESAHQLGYTKLVFEPAAQIDGAPTGEFLLIYSHGCAWSSWGIGCDSDGLTLWHAPRGKTIGRFRSMHDALDKIREIAVGG